MIDLALLNIFWYYALQVHSALADISFPSDSQRSAMLGENLLNELIQEMLGSSFFVYRAGISINTFCFMG